MRVIIIEDEKPAADKLERLLRQEDPELEVLGKAISVKDAVTVLGQHQALTDLIFMDIQLVDGKSFEIFQKIEVEKPVIFTTAFDQYAIEAFKVNGIDYLLKPITTQAIKECLQRFQKLRSTMETTGGDHDYKSILHGLKDLVGKSYKNRFMVKVGERIRSITADDIGLFYAEGRTAFLITRNKSKYVVDYKLETLEELLNPKEFFRVNRTYILHIDSVKDVVVYSNSRLRIMPAMDFDKEIIVSREKVNAFKDWFNGMAG